MNIQEQFYNAITNNDIETIHFLMINKNFNPSIFCNLAIIEATKFGFIDIVKLLLTDHRVDPTDSNNDSIRSAFENGHLNIVNLLWQDQRVKDTLKKDDIDLYNKLIKKDKLKQKVEVF